VELVPGLGHSADAVQEFLKKRKRKKKDGKPGIPVAIKRFRHWPSPDNYVG
jgi:hypothetical protein